MHYSFSLRISSKDIVLVVKEKNGAILLWLVLLVRILHVFGEEFQVSVIVLVAIEGLVMFVGVVDMVVFVHKDRDGIFLVA